MSGAFRTSRAIVAHFCILLLASLVASAAGTTQERTYVFGINLALNASEAGSYAFEQSDTLIGLEIWRDWWNALPTSARTTQWGEVVSVELHVETWSGYGLGFTPEAQGYLQETYFNMTQNSSIDFYFGPAAFMGVIIREYMYSLGVEIMIHSLDSSEGFYRIPGSFGSPTANILTMTSWLPYLRVAQAETIVVIQINDYVYQTELCKGIVDQAPNNGLRVLQYYDNMPFDWYTLGAITGNPNNTAAWQAVMDEVIALNPDAVAICTYVDAPEFALNYIRSKGWAPKSFAISPLYYPLSDPSLLDYVIMPTQYSPVAKFSAQQYFNDSNGYNVLFNENYNRNASGVAALATLSGMLYTNMLVNSPTNSTADFITTLRTAQIQSFMGLSSMDVKDRQTMASLVAQLMDGGQTVNVVGPATASATTFVYPMPNWDQRVFDPKWGSGVEIGGVVLMVLGGILTLIWVTFLFVHRDHPVVRAASPVFCCFIILGSLIVYISIFTWMPGLITPAVCNLRAWLLPLGVMLMFASMLAKSHRVVRIYYSIYQAKNAIQVITISNMHVALIVAAIAFAQAVLSILMVTIQPPQAVIHVVDEHKISENYWVCTFPTAVKALFGIDVGFAGLLLAWGFYLAYRVRRVPISAYDESKVIGFSIYNTAFFAAIVIAIQMAVGNINRNATFIITAVCCFLGAGITTSTLFGSKWYSIYYPNSHENSGSRPSVTPYVRSTHSHASGNRSHNSASDADDAKTKNSSDGSAELKKRNADLEQQVEKLEAENAKQAKKIKKLKKDLKAARGANQSAAGAQYDL